MNVSARRALRRGGEALSSCVDLIIIIPWKQGPEVSFKKNEETPRTVHGDQFSSRSLKSPPRRVISCPGNWKLNEITSGQIEKWFWDEECLHSGAIQLIIPTICWKLRKTMETPYQNVLLSLSDAKIPGLCILLTVTCHRSRRSVGHPLISMLPGAVSWGLIINK